MLRRALTFLILSTALTAQTAANSGQIGGRVLDPAGVPLPGAEVQTRNLGTNANRTAVTDPEGRYAVGPIALGDYEVTVKAPNMESQTQQVYVSLGGRAEATFNLGLPQVKSSMNVTSGALEPAQTFSKAVLTDVQLRNLPSNGRRIRGMFLLTPSTQIEPECGGFAISGQKGLYTNINVDGGDYTNTHWCGHVEFSPSFSLEALQEFQVLRSTFSAEFGRSTGGVINLATKSGTNETHGSGFYLFRNKNTTAKDPFNREQIGLGQQFGGSVGTPIRKDKTFYFLAGDFQHNTKPVQVLYSELDNQAIRNSAGAQALLKTAPEAGLLAFSDSRSLTNRIDHRLSAKNTLMGRFDYIHNRVTDSAGAFIMSQGIGADSSTNRSVQNASPVNNRKDLTGMAQLTSVLSPRHVNEFRAQLVREYRPWDPGTGPEVTVRNGSPVQTVAIYGPQATGLSYGNIGYQFTDWRRQFIDNFSIVTGAHTVKFGVDANSVNGNTTFNAGWNGTYRFDALQDYLDHKPAQYTQFAGTGKLDLTMHQVAFYVQDEWRIRPGLTISPGFRYEVALLPQYSPAGVAQNRFPLATNIPSDKELIAPRLGLAWDPKQNGKTVIRIASGMFYAAPNMPLFEQAILGNGGNPEMSSNITLTGTATIANAFRAAGIDLAGAPLSGLPVFTGTQLNTLVAPENRVAGQTVYFFDPKFRLPRSIQFRAAVERELAHGVKASVDFTNINVSRMDRVRNINLPTPVADAAGRLIYQNVAATKPYSRYGFAYQTEATARSHYHSMNATLNLQRKKYMLDATYTLGWSYSADDHERGISSPNYDTAANLANEYSYSNIDQRHQFAASGMYYAPFGFEFSSTLRFNSGRPFSPLTGVDSNGDGVLKDRPVVNGAVMRRNLYRNTGLSDVSLRLQRNFNLPNEKARLSITGEIFNVFNFDNLEIGSAQMTWGTGTNPSGTFGHTMNPATGQYFTTATLRTSPFQAQLGLRLRF